MKVVTEENYKQIVLKRMIALCWVFLLICFIVKIFGGNFFAYIGDSVVINTISNNWYLSIPFQSIFYIFGTLLFYLVISNHKHKLQCVIIVLILNLFKQLAKINTLFVIISLCLEFVFMFIYPVVVWKINWANVIYINLLLIIFQIISLITKNISLFEFPVNDIAGYVYMLDYYIMVGLLFLYSKIKEITIMQLGLWFLSKDKTQLEEYKKVVVAKHEKKLAKIDAKIAKAK